MPRAYFKPENLQALARVFQEARKILENRNEVDPATLDLVAHRILALASNGMPPAAILGKALYRAGERKTWMPGQTAGSSFEEQRSVHH